MGLCVVAAVCEVYVFVDYIPVAAAVCEVYVFVCELYILFYSCVCICVGAAVCEVNNFVGEVYILLYICVAAAIGDECPVGSLRITAESESKSQSACDEQRQQGRSHAQKPPPRLPAGSQ